MKFLVNGADAEAAYAGFLEFKVVVKRNQSTSTYVEFRPLSKLSRARGH